MSLSIILAAEAGSQSVPLSVGSCTTGVGYSNAYTGVTPSVGTFDNLSGAYCYYQDVDSYSFRDSGGSWRYQGSVTNVTYNIALQAANSTWTGASAYHRICTPGPICTSSTGTSATN
ncbi:MAG: hypothetical protein HYX53_12895 [Chloroflexi bacterium]|nr:hypothetical protein [Chloroflexota bacterium]